MSNNVRTYEGMFLLEPGNPDFQAASEPAKAIMERYKAEIVSLRAWDERRLAYPIGGQKRGLYVLAYFKADPEAIKEIEHDCRLNEKILRVLILHREKVSEQELSAPTPAMGGARPPEPRIGEPMDEPPRFRREPADAAMAIDVVEEPEKPTDVLDVDDKPTA